MSLQVWLPLNGNLNNNGVADITVTNNGATVDANGKIGSCYYCSGSASSYINTNYSTNIGTDDFTIAMWIKIPTITSGSYYTVCTSKAASAASTGFGIYWNYSQKKFLWSTANGTQSQEIWMSTAVDSIVYDKWIHLAMVRNKNDARKGYFYINGVRYEIASIPVILDITTGTNLLLGKCSDGYYPLKAYYNDFRIYDHALSAKEVKEISKGLILHIPLDNNGAGNENLIKNSTQGAGISQTTYNLQDYNFSKALVNGTTYTISCKINMSSEKKAFAVYHSGGSIMCGPWIVNAGNGIYTWSFTATSQMASQTAGDGYGYARVYVSNVNGPQGSVALTGTANVDWIKIEEGEVATPWCPNITDALYSSLGFNTATVYDTSGYSNNGTMSSTKPTIASDAPRYSSSMLFADGTYISTTLPSVTGFANSYTFSWWGKCAAYEGKMYWGFSGGNRLNLYGTGGVYCWNTGDGANNKFGTVAIAGQADNNWHHFAVTGDGTTTKLYIDGVFKSNATTYKGITGNTLIFNGWDTGNSYNFNGQLSDFRLYATCLSAADVEELYKVSASVDNGNSLHCYSLVEE